MATTALTLIPIGAPIIFNSVLNNQSSDITYNPITGQFTFTRPGNYYVSWWVATDGAALSPEINFDIAVNGVPIFNASTPIVTGQMSGYALVTIGTVPSTLNLINTSSDVVALAQNVPVQAGIVIIEIA